MLVVAVEGDAFGAFLFHGTGVGKGADDGTLGIKGVGIHYAQGGGIFGAVLLQIFVVHDKDVGVARTMFLYLVVEVVRYHQVIVPTVAGKAGFVEGFAHTADFQIGFQRGSDTGNLFGVGHE